MSTQRSFDWAAFAVVVVILFFNSRPTIGHSHASREATARPGIYRLEELTAPEIDALDRRKTLLLLPVGMLEEHGPRAFAGLTGWRRRDGTRRVCCKCAAGSHVSAIDFTDLLARLFAKK